MSFLYLYLKKKNNHFSSIFSVGGFWRNVSSNEISKACFVKSWNLEHSAVKTFAFNSSLGSLVSDFF